MARTTAQRSQSGNGARVLFETLGCAKNEVDTRDMKERLLAAGFRIADSVDECDAVVVNTCSFIRPAIEESLDAIFDIAGSETVAERGIPVIVAGCMPSRFGSELESELTEAAAFVPCSDEGDIAEVVARCLGEKCDDVPEGDGDDGAASVHDGAPCAFSAYVKVSDGCDRFCSYCTIPLIRGRYHSFPYDQIAAEARQQVEAGAREIVLIGQDTGLWGSDLEEGDTLATLLSRLAEEFPATWVRAMYTQPESVTPELLCAIATHANIAPYLDVPMQHVVPRILSDMNRKGSFDGFMGLVKVARDAVPGIAIRTTLIAGFPGETEEDFEELVRFVEQAELDYVGCFSYSCEEGTAAHDLPGQLDEEEKAYRAERLRTIADAVSSAIISHREGRTYPVLVEGIEEDGQPFGRAIVQAPEVDGVTYIEGANPGELLDATIADTLMYDMEAEAV